MLSINDILKNTCAKIHEGVSIGEVERGLLDNWILQADRDEIQKIHAVLYETAHMLSDCEDDEIVAILNHMSRSHNYNLQDWIPSEREKMEKFVYCVVRRGSFFDHMCDALTMPPEDCRKRWNDEFRSFQSTCEQHKRSWDIQNSYRLLKLERSSLNEKSFEEVMHRLSRECPQETGALQHVEILFSSYDELALKSPAYWRCVHLSKLDEETVRAVVHKICEFQKLHGKNSIPVGTQNLIENATVRFEIAQCEESNNDGTTEYIVRRVVSPANPKRSRIRFKRLRKFLWKKLKRFRTHP